MDKIEATKIVFSRIQNLDPDNVSKIMGLLLFQDHGGKEMIRLAFGPETLVHSVILKAKKDLGLLPSAGAVPSCPPSPSPFAGNLLPFSARHNNNNSSASSSSPCSSPSPRLLAGGVNLPSHLSIPNNHSSFPTAVSRANSTFPEDLMIPSPSSNGVSSFSIGSSSSSSSSSSSMNSSAAPFYGGGGETANFMDEFHLQDQLSFLNDGSPKQQRLKSPDFYYPQADLTSSPGANGDGMLFPSSYGGASWGAASVNGLPHRRSFSVSDICLGTSSEDPCGVFGWKPCLYFARGFCKNGTSCKFLHGEAAAADGAAVVGSPSKFEMIDQCPELTRSKSVQQQRLAAAAAAAAASSQQFMASANYPYSQVAANKCMNLLLQQQQLQADNPSLAAALMMNVDMHKFGRSRLDNSDFGMNASCGMANTASRQIYLTFPADSTFKEEDVSKYFSIYGPVQDVRIPYQQKRMFGFVTFVYPETVKLILAKGNPHFVCDARVLVKPYKEKGKIPDKFRKPQQLQQQMERGEFTVCGSPTGLDSRDPYDLGGRVFYNAPDLLWRRKLEEQADLQQVIELQSRRLMSLQLDVKRNHHHHRTQSTGSVIQSPIASPSFFSQSPFSSSDRSSPEAVEENGSGSVMGNTAIVAADHKFHRSSHLTEKEKQISAINGANGIGKDNPPKEESDLPESVSFEHNLPDSPFASPKAAGDYSTAFSAGETDKIAGSPLANDNLAATTILPPTSSLDISPLRSCYFQAPSYSSGHGAIGM